MVSRIGALCALCRMRPSTPTGEHIWPSWYLRNQDRRGAGPFAWTHNGEPILDRRNTPMAAGVVRMRQQLPMCCDCNGVLAARFETPTKDVLRQLFGQQGNMVLTAEDAARVGRWFAKTMLLAAHPDAHYEHPAVDRVALRLQASEMPAGEFYEWLVTGNSPPEGLSVWLHRSDPMRTASPLHRMPLPCVTADGQTTEFLALTVSLHGLCVDVVVHSGWPIVHPLVEAGQAVRLTPPPTASVDLTDLPVLAHNAVRWTRIQLTLVDGALGSPDLAPLRASDEPMRLLPEVFPFTTHWGF